MNFTHNELVQKINLVGIGGSTRSGSRNSAALQFAMARAALQGASFEVVDLQFADLPLLNRGLELENYPAGVAHLVAAVQRADGFIFNSPTYHGSMSGAFKNALDLLIYGDESYLAGKPVGILAVGGANGAPVLEMITSAVHSLKGMVTPSRVLLPHGALDGENRITDGKLVERIDRMLNEVIDIAAAMKIANALSETVQPA